MLERESSQPSGLLLAITSVRRDRMQLDETLDRGRNLVIHAPAGVGKSTLLRHTTRVKTAEARAGVETNFIPVYVSARGLAARSGSFAERLSAEVADDIGMRASGPIDRAIFEHPPIAGARWLILVDGLDEVIGSHAREALLRALQIHATDTSGHYRFVVTTRAVEGAAHPSDDAWQDYTLPPFDDDEVTAFAQRWFGAGGRSREFLDWIVDRQLEELAKNPLFATLLAIVFDAADNPPLQAKRHDLFDRFLSILLDAEEAARQTRAAMIDEWENRHGPTGRDAANGLYDARRDLLTVIAQRTLANTNAVQLDEIITLVRDRIGFSFDVDPEWLRVQVAALLERAGVLTVSHDQVLFTHRALAEHLVATRFARDHAPASVDAHILAERAVAERQPEVLLRAVEIWSANGIDCSGLLARMRDGGKIGAIIAGDALLGKAMVTPEERDATVTAIAAIARETDLGNTLLQNRALATLGRLRNVASAADALAAIVTDGTLYPDRRAAAALELGKHQRTAELLSALRDPAEHGDVRTFAGLALAAAGHRDTVIEALLPVVRDSTRSAHERWNLNRALGETQCYDGYAYLACDPAAPAEVKQLSLTVLSSKDAWSALSKLSTDQSVTPEVRAAATALTTSP